MNRKWLIAGTTTVAVIIIVIVFGAVFLNSPEPKSPLFTVAGRQQTTKSVGGYDVISWNFTFGYNGEETLQNVNLFLNNDDMSFKTVPEVTKGWGYEYVWTPGDINANATITVSWQGGTEYYEFQPFYFLDK